MTSLVALMTAVIIFVGGAFFVKHQSAKAVTEQQVTLNPYIYDQLPLAPEQVSSLVRLETMDGRFYCSGVVISKNLVLTAAHCILVEAYSGMMLNPEKIKITSEQIPGKKQTIAIGFAYAANARADYGVIKGDFRKFNVAKITTSNTLMYSLSDQLASCGFPWGATNSVCYPLEQRPGKALAKAFSFGFIGFLYPGMSGGPVVDRKSGLVFGVNSAVDTQNDDLVIVPLIGLQELILKTGK